jgi:bifunctional enzyme CysN/CysC
MLLDGDQVRHGLCGDLGFTIDDRIENIRRIAHVARLFFEHGDVTLCTFISPFRRERALARSLVPEGRFLEVHVDTSIDECRRRDPKGLYARADAGQIPNFTGISSPYEAPENPEITIKTTETTIDEAVEIILERLRAIAALTTA